MRKSQPSALAASAAPSPAPCAPPLRWSVETDDELLALRLRARRRAVPLGDRRGDVRDIGLGLVDIVVGSRRGDAERDERARGEQARSGNQISTFVPPSDLLTSLRRARPAAPAFTRRPDSASEPLAPPVAWRGFHGRSPQRGEKRRMRPLTRDSLPQGGERGRSQAYALTTRLLDRAEPARRPCAGAARRRPARWRRPASCR